MMITAATLSKATSCPLKRAERWVDSINSAMSEYAINTPDRIAAFLAQISHESGRMLYVRELWGPTMAQSKYEGRQDLGNSCFGDGHRYCGRGLIQITGRSNYKACGNALGLDLEAHPEMLEAPNIAARSAAWFWASHGCNELADAGHFDAITKRINGGLNGRVDRLALFESAREALSSLNKEQDHG